MTVVGSGRIFAGALALLALLATGCDGERGKADESPSPQPETVSDEEQVVRNDDLPAHVAVTVSGDQEFSWEGDTTIRVTRAGSLGLAVNLLSAGTVLPQQLEDEPRASFRWAYDLVNEFTDEPGTYELRPRQDGDQIASNAFVIFIRAKEEAPLPPRTEEDVEVYLEYNQVKQACMLTIEEGSGDRGSLQCPELATADGRTVALQVTWDVVEDEQT